MSRLRNSEAARLKQLVVASNGCVKKLQQKLDLAEKLLKVRPGPAACALLRPCAPDRHGKRPVAGIAVVSFILSLPLHCFPASRSCNSAPLFHFLQPQLSA